MKQKFDVTGMSCAACSARVEKCVSKLAGVDSVAVNLLANNMVVEYDEGALDDGAIIKAVCDAGYGADVHVGRGAGAASAGAGAGGVSLAGPGSAQVSAAALEAESMKKRLIASIIFFIPLFYISMGHMVGLPQPGFLMGAENAITYGMAQLVLTAILMYINRKYYEVGFPALWHRAPNMDSLIAVGSSAAVIYGIFAIIRIGHGLAVQDWALVEQYHMDMYFESAGTILTLITVGKYLEARSKGKTTDAVSRLLDLSPDTALAERDGHEVEIRIEEVKAGDILIVKPGSKIPVDGVIVEGASSVDESLITGESIPVDKSEGDSVIGASINKSGFFKMRAEKVGEDTALFRIIQLVEEAGGSKAPIARLADKISGIFVPVVMVIAFVSAVAWLIAGQTFEFALSTGIAVLVISCPCALGLATPAAIMAGTGRGAELGVLYKNAEILENAHLVDTVVMDKTGTLTTGKPGVTGIFLAEGSNIGAGGVIVNKLNPDADGAVMGADAASGKGLAAGAGVDSGKPGVHSAAGIGTYADVAAGSKNYLLSMAAAVEKQSEHPLAQAILAYAEEKGLDVPEASGFEAVHGKGVSAEIAGKRWIGGNARMMKEEGVDVSRAEAFAAESAGRGETPLYFAENGKLMGVIAVADMIRPESAAAVSEFKHMGIDVIMLTGDNSKTASAIAGRLGIDNVVSEILPEDKDKEVRSLMEKGRKVAMVGDGINDAPALARADVGIAIGAGTDVAIESADVVLMKSSTLDAVSSIQLSRAVIKNVKMNLFWAFFYNVIGIPIAAGVLYPMFAFKLNPMFGAAAMSLSSFCVVSNALRLRWFKPHAAADPDIVDGPGPVIENNEFVMENEGGNQMEKTLNVEGMMCKNCVAHVEKALKGIEGVADAVANLDAKTATVVLNADVADDVLVSAVTAEGYEASMA